MSALILFWIVFFSGTCYILADSEEKKVHWTDITKDPFASISDRNSSNNGADDKFIYKDADYNSYEQLLIRDGITRWHNKNSKADWSSGAYIPKLTEVVEEEREKRTTYAIVKTILKIIGGIILVLLFGRLCAYLCRKKNQEVISNAEETVPALPSNTNTTGTQQFPQQPGSCPLSQMPNPSAPYAYSSLQQNPLNPAVPYPTASHSTPPYPAAPYPTAPYSTAPYPTAPYPASPYPSVPYSTAPYPIAPYPAVPYPAVPYPTGPGSSPPVPTCEEKEANNQVLL